MKSPINSIYSDPAKLNKRYLQNNPFPHIVLLEKKEVYFKIDYGWPASLTVKPIMREHFPDDFTGIIASVETWDELMKGLDPNRKID